MDSLFFFKVAMSKKKFTPQSQRPKKGLAQNAAKQKIYLDRDGQIEKLKADGLIILDEGRAKIS